MTRMRRRIGVASAVVASLTLAACGAGNSGDNDESGEAIIVGTTDKVVSIDPAGSYDNGSMAVQTQVFQYLLNFPAGSTELTPDAAEECDFTTPTEYSCTLKEGLTFGNGNELTASDVVFSYQRIVDINDPNGPASLLGNMESVEATDDRTVVFTLKKGNDQTWPQILVSPAGPILDEESFDADALVDDAEAVESGGFSGPYTIGKYTKNELAEFKVNPDYDGTFGEAKSDVTMRYYADSNNLRLDVEKGDIDVAHRTLTPTDVENLQQSDKVKVHTGPGGELRYIVFNLKTMPGDTDEQKLAIRKAIASSINREEISEQVYKGTYTPAYSVVPDGQPGATEPFKEIYGEEPDVDAATAFLEDAGVETPVSLKLQWNPDHYGGSSDQEYAAIKRQLDETGLFEVDLQSTEWTTYAEERTKDAYPAYQLGWFPDFPDPDNYLTPFFAPNNFLASHYEDDEMTRLLAAEATEPDEAKREALIAEIQTLQAEQIPTLPLLTGAQVAVAGTDVKGVSDTLDASFKFRFSALSK